MTTLMTASIEAEGTMIRIITGITRMNIEKRSRYTTGITDRDAD